MTSVQPAVTARTSSFCFYDIEALRNVFTLCALTRYVGIETQDLEIFYLLDDPALDAEVNTRESWDMIHQHLLAENPSLPQVYVRPWNLGTPAGAERLAELMGLSDAGQVCHRTEPSSFDIRFRPVCDTDDDFNPALHPYLVGYNSMNYDTVMLALLLEAAFSQSAEQPKRLKDASNLRRALADQLQLTPEAQDLRQQLEDTTALVRQLSQQKSIFERPSAYRLRQDNDRLFSDHIDYMPGYLGWNRLASKLRQSMLRSGRHIDASRLNEQQSKVSLKRLLGMLGRQIKESQKLSQNTRITSLAEFAELIAYNVSDCLGLEQLFDYPHYSSNFDLRAGLLAQYSETRYEKDGKRIRRDRLSIDSSSAKFVGRILAPHESLEDLPAVSFDYPHPEVAREQGRTPVNVLQQAKDFFESRVAPDPETDPETTPDATPALREAHAQFMEVYRYYQSIEGRNFNASQHYQDRYDLAAQVLDEIPKRPNNIPYFTKDGTPSACFVTFSTGGIHGAEADLESFTLANIAYTEAQNMILRARLVFPDAREFVAAAKAQHRQLTLSDGSTVDKTLVLYGSDPAKVKFRKPKSGDPEQQEQLARAMADYPEDPAGLLATQRPAERELDFICDDGTVLAGKTVLQNQTAANASYRDSPKVNAPQLFVKNKNNDATKLEKKYVRKSAGLVIHEDFTSYYPNLLRNMRAFYNPELGEDRYTQIFFDKERYGKQMKAPGLDPVEKARLGTLREGTKLILNSASGAGDAGHDTPIRMNNMIISMRIIGQLVSWMIGQAQTLEGARIISTNTDGLYSVVARDEDPANQPDTFTVAVNNRVLEEQAALIGVDIEPELMFLISKDSNNRLELTAPELGESLVESKILNAGGGTLACYEGPNPKKALAHPAVLDYALAKYLQRTAARGETALSEPFDQALGMELLQSAIRPDDPVGTLLMFQNMITASRGSITYPVSVAPISPEHGLKFNALGHVEGISDPQHLQLVNRTFFVRADTPGARSLFAVGAWAVPKAQAKPDAEVGEDEQPHRTPLRRDPFALEMLRHHGWVGSRAELSQSEGGVLLPDDQMITARVISRVDPCHPVLIVNDDLHALDSPRQAELIAALDLDVYLQALEHTFTENWRNTTP